MPDASIMVGGYIADYGAAMAAGAKRLFVLLMRLNFDPMMILSQNL